MYYESFVDGLPCSRMHIVRMTRLFISINKKIIYMNFHWRAHWVKMVYRDIHTLTASIIL